MWVPIAVPTLCYMCVRALAQVCVLSLVRTSASSRPPSLCVLFVVMHWVSTVEVGWGGVCGPVGPSVARVQGLVPVRPQPQALRPQEGHWRGPGACAWMAVVPLFPHAVVVAGELGARDRVRCVGFGEGGGARISSVCSGRLL
jgi:hypothetical protein